MFKRKIDHGREKQLDLFDMVGEISPGKFDQPDFQQDTRPLGVRLKEAISEAIKNSGLKRYDIAGQMQEHLGVDISDNMLNSWTAESKEGHRMPAEYYPIFCKITQNYKVLDILVAAAGGRMARSQEIYYLEVGRAQQGVKFWQHELSRLQSERDRSKGVSR